MKVKVFRVENYPVGDIYYSHYNKEFYITRPKIVGYRFKKTFKDIPIVVKGPLSTDLAEIFQAKYKDFTFAAEELGLPIYFVFEIQSKGGKIDISKPVVNLNFDLSFYLMASGEKKDKIELEGLSITVYKKLKDLLDNNGKLKQFFKELEARKNEKVEYTVDVVGYIKGKEIRFVENLRTQANQELNKKLLDAYNRQQYRVFLITANDKGKENYRQYLVIFENEFEEEDISEKLFEVIKNIDKYKRDDSEEKAKIVEDYKRKFFALRSLVAAPQIKLEYYLDEKLRNDPVIKKALNVSMAMRIGRQRFLLYTPSTVLCYGILKYLPHRLQNFVDSLESKLENKELVFVMRKGDFELKIVAGIDASNEIIQSYRDFFNRMIEFIYKETGERINLIGLVNLVRDYIQNSLVSEKISQEKDVFYLEVSPYDFNIADNSLMRTIERLLQKLDYKVYFYYNPEEVSFTDMETAKSKALAFLDIIAGIEEKKFNLTIDGLLYFINSGLMSAKRQGITREAFAFYKAVDVLADALMQTVIDEIMRDDLINNFKNVIADLIILNSILSSATLSLPLMSRDVRERSIGEAWLEDVRALNAIVPPPSKYRLGKEYPNWKYEAKMETAGNALIVNPSAQPLDLLLEYLKDQETIYKVELLNDFINLLDAVYYLKKGDESKFNMYASQIEFPNNRKILEEIKERIGKQSSNQSSNPV